jgi:Spy/CpxP family protein refolding chaperone
MKRNHTLIAGVVAGVALSVAAATYAQPFGGMGHGYGPGMGMGPGHGAMAGVNHAAMADARLSDLKAQLKITTGQEAAWQAFATQAQAQAASMQAMHAQMQPGTGTAPERMAQRTAAMQQRAAGMAAMTNAFSALYAVLTPEQKAIADQNVGMMGPGGMHRGFGARAG